MQHKNCPFCHEQILSEAIKCKHCNEFLKPNPRRHVVWQKEQPQKVIVETKKSSLNTILVLMAIAALSVILFGF